MMKKVWKLCLCLLLNILVSPAYAGDVPLKIRSLFNIKGVFCAIKTNGVLGYANRHSARAGRGGGISSTNALFFLENGVNEISLEMGALGWFSKDNMNDKERASFIPLSGCKLELVRFEKQQQKTLMLIDVVVNQHGIPDIVSNEKNMVVSKKIQAEQVVQGHVNADFFDERYFPKGMELYQFSQKINISDIPEWEWVHATPFTGDEEQIQKLRTAYTELAEIINSHDRSRLKKNHKIALKAWAMTTGDTEDAILLSQYTKEEIEGGEVKIDPINWSDYSIRVMNKGRLVQFYNKSNPTYSPLTYHAIEDGENITGTYAPMFSLIDGKFEVIM